MVGELDKYIQQAHDVETTLHRRRCDVITSHRRQYSVILMLCARWALVVIA